MSGLIPILTVAVQFSCIAAIAFSGGLFAGSNSGRIAQVGAALLGLWALWAMPRASINVSPVVRSGAVLAGRGPYRLIRHPMYSAVLMFCAAALLDNPGLFNGLWLLILTADLIFKLRYEEGRLRERFPQYQQYARETWRLVPWIY